MDIAVKATSLRFKKNILSVYSYCSIFILTDLVLFYFLIISFYIPFLISILIYNFMIILIYFMASKYTRTIIEFDEEFGIRWILKSEVLYYLKWDEIISVLNHSVFGCQSIIFNGDKKNTYCNINKNKLQRIISICPDEKLKIKLQEIKLYI
jgi:hypothetical protein